MTGFNIAGYLIFAFVTSIKPGHNNYILFSHGKSYGLWVLFGDLISKIIQSEKGNHILGYFLFGLMIISIVMIWIE